MMTEIPAVIQKLHSRYEKLISSKHDWQQHRTLVIVLRGFHRVVVSFPDSGSIVCQRDRNHGSYVTSERVFDFDNPKLLEKLVAYIESDVQAGEWEQWLPMRCVDAETQNEIDDLLKKFEGDDE